MVIAMTMPDYYKMLDLDRSATPEQVWLNFHKLEFLAAHKKARVDRKKLFELHYAYHVLSDEVLRYYYDMAYDRRPLWGIPWSVRRAAVPFLTGFVAGILLYLALVLA